MAEYVIMPRADYVAACDSIRAKTGKSDLIKSSDLSTEITSITGGGGSADERVKYVTFMSEDGTEELIKYPVISGDTCHDIVADGLISTPTKESTEAIVYTFGGWSLTDGGSVDSTALQNVTENRTVYAAFTESARIYTVRFFDGETLVNTEQVAYGGSSSYIYEKDGYIFKGWSPEAENITGDLDCYAQLEKGVGTLEETSWADISEISTAGEAENYWSVGERKTITLNGTIGTLSISATNFYVYILGFNHNETIEGTGIHFGMFMDIGTGNKVALVDSSYSSRDLSGSKIFNMNHWSNMSLSGTNYGGWKACDMRYDILGSTDVAPSNYGSIKNSSNYGGYNATETCATNPVANTLMAALPENLRVVMKPMTKYTDNYGNKSTNVSSSTDYLPLLAEYEVFGKRTNANTAEQNKQAQYRYFALSSSNKKMNAHNAPTTDAGYLLRSPYYNDARQFCYAINGAPNEKYACYSYGLAPIFKV